MGPLLLPNRMPAVAGMEVPAQFYCITNTPAPLAGMKLPSSRTPWEALAGAGILHVVCLAGNHPDYNPNPLKLLHAVALQDLVLGGPPVDPDREAEKIKAAVEEIVPKLQAGQGVVVHCVGGRGRTGTVVGCVLCALGYSADEIIRYLDTLHRARGKSGWPESPWQADLIQRFCL